MSQHEVLHVSWNRWSGMFHYKFNQPLNNWDVSNVQNMALMFGATSGTNGRGAFNQNIGNWDVQMSLTCNQCLKVTEHLIKIYLTGM